MSRRMIALAGALALSAALAGCGKVGQLERPGPMFGHAATEATATAPRKQDPSRPVETVDPRERDRTATTLSPPPPSVEPDPDAPAQPPQ